MKSILASLLIAGTAIGQVYTSTNDAGGIMSTRYREDHDYAVGAVTTNAEMPAVKVEPVPHRIIGEGIEIPSFVLTNETTGVGFEFRVNQYGQLVGGVTNHASPRRPKAAIDADFEKLEGGKSNRLTRIERIAVDLKQVDGTISNITANAATWPNQAQRETISAIKVAVRNLMQATEKVRKELEP